MCLSVQVKLEPQDDELEEGSLNGSAGDLLDHDATVAAEEEEARYHGHHYVASNRVNGARLMDQG